MASSALDRLRAIDEPPRAAPPPPEKPRGVIATIVVGIGLLLVKFKAVVWVVLAKGKLLLGLLQLGKFGTTAWTMALVAALYARYYGAPFAIGLVVLTLIHELGHGAAARRLGLPVGAPVFIPFVGAMIALRAQPRSTWEDFVIGAGGPVAGSAGGALCLLGALAAGSTGREGAPTGGVFFAVGYFALLMNLFNLMPVWQLDGARMCAPIARLGMAIGTAWLLAVTIATAVISDYLNPVALFVVALGGFQLGRGWWRQHRHRPSTALERLTELDAREAAIPDAVPPARRRTAALVYFGLATALVVATHLLHGQLPPVPR